MCLSGILICYFKRVGHGLTRFHIRDIQDMLIFFVHSLMEWNGLNFVPQIWTKGGDMTRYMDDRTQRHRYRRLFTFGAFFVIAFWGGQDVAQSHPAAVQSPPALDQAPAGPLQSGSRKYRDCVAAARNDTQGRERCLDEELAYQQRALDGLYQERVAELDAAQLDVLRAEYRAWQQETDRLCGPTAGAGPVAQACRLDRIIAQYDVLNYHPSSSASAYWAEDMPDANGALELRLGDAVIAMQSDGCTDRIGVLACSNVRLQVSTSTLRRQTLLLPDIWFPETEGPDHSSSTGYRGALRGGFADGLYGIILSDINADGHEDLMVWSGRDGSYGDPSYTYYLYDTKTRRLVENTALAKLVEGHSLSRIVDGRLFVWYRSGPCDRGEKTIDIRDNEPRIVERKDYTTCGDDGL